MKTRVLSIILVIIIPSICFAQNNSQLTININSFGTYDMSGKSYYIESCMDNLPTNDLEFKEYASYIDMVMKMNGAIQCDDHDNADIVILMHFDITDESYLINVPKPIFGQYLSSVTTTSSSNGSVNVEGFSNSQGWIDVDGYYARGFGNVNAYGTETTRTNSYYNYSYGITGYHNVTKKVDNYHSVINLYAYDNKRIETPEMVWKTSISSEGSVSDYRIVFPYLAFSTISYIGNDTRMMITETLNPNNYIYKLWINGRLFDDGIYHPRCKRIETDKLIELVLSEKTNNEIIITIHERYSSSWDRIWTPQKENFFIVVDGQEIGCSELDSIYDEGAIYSVFHFSCQQIEDSKEVDLIGYKNSKRKKVADAWYGIEIK